LKKLKLIPAIAFIILGGAIMLESMISGTLHFTGNSHEDFQTFNIERQPSQAPIKTSFFSVEKGQTLSVWFRCSNRQLENKNLKIAVSLINEDGAVIWEAGKDFRFGNIRNSARRVKYYKLGNYNFKKEFRGYLHSELDGTWIPTTTSALVLRRSPHLLLPLKQIALFVAGIFVLIVGIETIVNSSK
jgi:hypothetical protein